MTKQAKKEETIKCYCFSKHGNPHCPLAKHPDDLKKYFNYFTEEIIWVEIDTAFVCDEERTKQCNDCPFK